MTICCIICTNEKCEPLKLKLSEQVPLLRHRRYPVIAVRTCDRLSPSCIVLVLQDEQGYLGLWQQLLRPGWWLLLQQHPRPGPTLAPGTASTTVGFSLSVAPPAQTAASTGFSFCNIPAQTAGGGFSLTNSSAVQATPSTGFGFTAVPAGTAQTTANAFSFGASGAAPATSSFSCGASVPTTATVKPTGTQPAGFSFGAAMAAPASTVVTAPTSQGLGFTTKSPAPAAVASGLPLLASVLPASATTGFSLTTPAAPTLSAGFGFKPTATALTVTTATSTAPTAAAAATSGFSLGVKTPASFSLAASAAPTVTTSTLTPASVSTACATTTATSSSRTVLQKQMNKGTLGFGSSSSGQAGGFSFSNTPAPAPTLAPGTASTTVGFSLSVAPPAQTAASTGFSFCNIPAQTAGGGFSLTNSSAVQATPSTGFGFTAVPAGTAQTTANAFSFGASGAAPATSSFSCGASVPTTATVKPTGTQPAGFSFGAAMAAPASTVVTAPTSQGLGFTTKSPAPAAVASGLPLLASVLPASATTGFSLTTPAAPTLSAGFGFKPTATALTVTTATSTAPTAAAAATSGFSLGVKTPASFSLAASAAPTVTTSTLTPASVSTACATTTATSSSSPPVMSYTQLESLINKWSVELEDQEKHFLQQATQVNAWDRMLIENGEKITALHRQVEKVKLDQKRLDQELDFILSQQKELEDLLVPLEESVKDQNGTIYLQHADEERERTYKLAENIDAQLKRMAQDLKEIIQHLNTSSGCSEISDPLQQICKILNAHMDSLHWIDQNSVLLQKKVEDVSKQCDGRRKEQERNFTISFD
ncbi:nucleoporin 62 like [Callorhinchus milii]|uniref:nucleoporin 62 like n=1 Tax=Callorhinchus milii TaxID=7868 RepID=UPI001C3F82FE|nr:nucleoporin 62 like [Callorhinchus milii]